MSQPVLNREQTREVDRRAIEECGMSGLVLMENAGRGVADVLYREGITGPVVICCGKGNNAGDGFVLARRLDLFRHQVKVLLWCDPDELTGDAAANFEILRHTDVPIEVFAGAHDAARLEAELLGAAWFVDALLGTGARGAPRPPLDEVIPVLNAHPARRLAVDLPSGLDCDTGEAADPTFRADVTCTFVAHKPGYAGAGAVTGKVHVVDIGAPRKLIEDVFNRA